MQANITTNGHCQHDMLELTRQKLYANGTPYGW